MGYNISLRSAHFHVPEAWTVLRALKNLNKQDHLKRGGSWAEGEKTESWFSWMPTDWDETCTSVQEVFELLGFETKIVDGPSGKAVSLEVYEGKAGQEDLFCRAVAPYMEKGSYLEWIGEDFAEEVWVVQDGELKCLVREEKSKWWE